MDYYRSHWVEIDQERLATYDELMQWTTLHEVFLQGLEFESYECVVDYGCGPGWIALELARRLNSQGRVIACDINQDLLSLGEKHSVDAGLSQEIKWCHVTDDQVPIPDSSADLVFVKNVMGYVPSIDTMLAEFLRVLKPGGIVRISDSDWDLFIVEPLGQERLDELKKYASHAFKDPHVGRHLYSKGYLAEAKEHLLKGAGFSERINLLFWGAMTHYYLGITYFDMEEYEISQNYYEKATSLRRPSSVPPSWVNYWKMLLALARVMNNEKDIAINEIFEWVYDSKTKSELGVMSACIGRIFMCMDDQHLSEAEEWIKKAIEEHKKYGMMWYLAKDHALYAELFKQKGDRSKARENLNKAIDLFKKCGADGWVEKYEKELVTLS